MVDRMEIVKSYLCLFIALLTIAKMFNEILVKGSTSSSQKAESESGSDDEDAARAAAVRPPSADFYVALHHIANILLQLVQQIEVNVFQLLDSHPDFDVTSQRAAGAQFNLLKARVQAMGLKSKDLLGRAASCVKQTAHREEMIGMWKAFNKSLPPILMPAMLADEQQRTAASEGRVFLTMNDVRNYFFSYKPESGA